MKSATVLADTATFFVVAWLLGEQARVQTPKTVHRFVITAKFVRSLINRMWLSKPEKW